MNKPLKYCLPRSWQGIICSVGDINPYFFRAKPIVRWGWKPTGLIIRLPVDHGLIFGEKDNMCRFLGPNE
jgi:hypothetical protein